MEYLYLIASVVCMATSSVFGTYYNRKNEGRENIAVFYNFLLMTAAFVCFSVLYAFNFSFARGVVKYAVLFAFFFVLCNVGIVNALKTGPVAITSLILQFSLIGVTVWGLIFWNAKFSAPTIVGLVLVIVSLVLCLCNKSEKESGKTRKISWKWVLYASFAFVGNAGCSIVQRTQQTAYNGQHANLLMFLATGISAVTCLIWFLFSGKKHIKTVLKESWQYPVFAGICNALLNICVMLLATSSLSPGVIYPVIAVGGLAITTLYSAFVFKEKLVWQQWFGVTLGAIAVAVLSL